MYLATDSFSACDQANMLFPGKANKPKLDTQDEKAKSYS
jgi:hypothetical protein